MKLQCAHCTFAASSVDLNKDNAIAEVILTFAKHITSHKHIELAIKRDVMQTAAIASTVIMIAKHTTLLDSFSTDDYIQQEFSKLVDKLQDCLGVEVFDNKPGGNPPVDSALQDSKVGVSSKSETLGTVEVQDRSPAD